MLTHSLYLTIFKINYVMKKDWGADLENQIDIVVVGITILESYLLWQVNYIIKVFSIYPFIHKITWSLKARDKL
jgi:hypothetical protein